MESPAPTPFTRVPFGAGAAETLPSAATRLLLHRPWKPVHLWHPFPEAFLRRGTTSSPCLEFYIKDLAQFMVVGLDQKWMILKDIDQKVAGGVNYDHCPVS